jgi:hypothetical protein
MSCLHDLSPYSIMNINEIQIFCITKRTWNVRKTWLVISITLLTVKCSNDNVILKNHAEKEIQIVFTECGILSDNVNESSLNICSTHFSHIIERSVKRSRRINCEIPPCICPHPEARSTRKKDRLLTFQNVISVRENFGIILPVGTRKYIRK